MTHSFLLHNYLVHQANRPSLKFSTMFQKFENAHYPGLTDGCLHFNAKVLGEI